MEEHHQIDQLREAFAGKKEWQVTDVTPPEESFSKDDIPNQTALKMGTIILAGGRATRLGVSGPKGSFVIAGKSLFAHLLEKVKANTPEMVVAIMTAPDNDQETRAFLEKNSYFGLDPAKVDFFVQDVVPTFTLDGEFCVSEDGVSICTPAGNGSVFQSFTKSKIKEKWEHLSIGAVNFVPIDNPLADPSDLRGAHLIQREDVDLVVKTVERASPEEKVGVFAKKGDALYVQEYFELPDEEKGKILNSGKLYWNFANIGIFTTTFSFLDRAAEFSLPWHRVQKQSHIQFETFIFDAFQIARGFSMISYPRKEIFAPIKSPQDVQEVEKLLTRHLHNFSSPAKKPLF